MASLTMEIYFDYIATEPAGKHLIGGSITRLAVIGSASHIYTYYLETSTVTKTRTWSWKQVVPAQGSGKGIKVSGYRKYLKLRLRFQMTYLKM